MIRFILATLLLFLLYRLFRAATAIGQVRKTWTQVQTEAQKFRASQRKVEGEPTKLVACAQCGTYVAQKDALDSHDKTFCSSDCQNAYKGGSA